MDLTGDLASVEVSLNTWVVPVAATVQQAEATTQEVATKPQEEQRDYIIGAPVATEQSISIQLVRRENPAKKKQCNELLEISQSNSPTPPAIANRSLQMPVASGNISVQTFIPMRSSQQAKRSSSQVDQASSRNRQGGSRRN